jgi:GNAT superfamily N-acetyltransferase
MQVRPGDAADRARVATFLDEMGSRRVARLGALVSALDHPALIAEEDERLLGVLTYIMETGESCEVLTLHASERRRGVGTALVAALEALASRSGCTRLFLITTNDNVDALRFYQRRGFEMAFLHRRAVDSSRARLKPEIPPLGDHGIPLRDEIELEKILPIKP